MSLAQLLQLKMENTRQASFFFCGDKLAQQFEWGTQIGVTYKCGGFDFKDTLMQDLSHALRLPWRTLNAI